MKSITINPARIVNHPAWPKRFSPREDLKMENVQTIYTMGWDDTRPEVILMEIPEGEQVTASPLFAGRENPTHYALVGHKRSIACFEAGLDKIPAKVVNAEEAQNYLGIINDTGNTPLTKGQGAVLIADFVRSQGYDKYGKDVHRDVCKHLLDVLVEIAPPKLTKENKEKVEAIEKDIRALNADVPEGEYRNRQLAKHLAEKAEIYVSYYYGRLQEMSPIGFLPEDFAKGMCAYFDGHIEKGQLPADLFWNDETDKAKPIKTVLESEAKKALAQGEDYETPCADFWADPENYAGETIGSNSDVLNEEKERMMSRKDLKEVRDKCKNGLVIGILDAILSKADDSESRIIANDRQING